MDKVIDAQTRILQKYLQYAANTEFGKSFDFKSIKSYQEYVNAIPVSNFDRYKKYREMLKRGVPDLVWPGSATEFAISAGTTGEPKVIPIFDERRKSDKVFLRRVAISYLKSNPNIFKLWGKQLSLPGMLEEWPDYPGMTFGEISGLLATYAPPLLARQQLIPAHEAVKMSFQEKVERSIELGIKSDVRVFTSLPSVALRFIQQMLEMTGKKSLAEIWPNLQAIITGGEPLPSYKAHILKLSEGIKPNFVENYGASEGYFAFNTDQSRDDMKLVVDNNVFFEWIPNPSENREELLQQTPIPTWEVETGKRYAMVVTSNSGMWRYLLNDIIIFTELETPRIRVAGRASEVLDNYGETIEAFHIKQTLEEISKKHGGIFSTWCIGVVLNDQYTSPTHMWFIEWADKPRDMAAFAKDADAYLISINRSYEIRRKGEAIAKPRFFDLSKTALEEWRSQHFKVKAQTKTPRMIRDIDKCLSLMEKCNPSV